MYLIASIGIGIICPQRIGELRRELPPQMRRMIGCTRYERSYRILTLAVTISLAIAIATREIVRFVQGRGIEDASVCARDELVREMRPVVERQSGPTIGTVCESLSSAQQQQQKKKDVRRKNSLVEGFDRVVRERIERVETVVVTCGTVNDAPGCGWVVQSIGIDSD